VELWLVGASGKVIRQVTHAYPQQAEFFAVGGGTAPFVVYSDGTAIWRVNLDGSGTRRVARVSAGGLAISRDGTKLAYSASPPLRPELAALDESNVDGASPRALFTGTAAHNCGILSPTWSPDGKWIAFQLCTDKGSFDILNAIWLVHPDGTGLHELVRGFAPTWSPDGKWIAYQLPDPVGTGSQTGLFMVHPDGTGKKQITAYGEPADTLGGDEPNW
jgi:TolB protein